MSAMIEETAARKHQDDSMPVNYAHQDNLLGESACFLEVLEQVSRLAPLNKPVLVVGERGTGKELIAARLHYLSGRWQETFVKLNCAAINENLLETELFGHESGAFTGASKRHQGRFEVADGGSLFLDELATSSSRIQEKLLRVIEYGEFERVGGSETIKTDVRLIAATNEDLPALAAAGKFRDDLLDRLAFDVITLPPLRARREDIILLADSFAVNMTRELGREFFAGFSDAAQKALLAWPWPGNVRELKNVVERAVYRTAEDKPIKDIEFDAFASPYRPESRINNDAGSGTGSGKTLKLPVELKTEVKEFEIRLLQQALEECQFNQRKTADILGLTYHQLRGYLKKYQLLEQEL